MSEYKLGAEIIARSKASTWDEAKLEWELESVFHQEEPETCLCGHFPINEVCLLRNRLNGNTADVGNCCVKKFLGLQSDKIFQALRRIRNDLSRPLNGETIDHARKSGWINDWEYRFSMDTVRKRKLTASQMLKRQQINQRVIQNVMVKRRQPPRPKGGQ